VDNKQKYQYNLVNPDKLFPLQDFLSHCNLLDQYISFGVAVFLHHKLLNIRTIETIDQVCLCKVVDPDNLFPLQDVLSHCNLLDHYISFCVAVFLHHKLLNMLTNLSTDQVYLCNLPGIKVYVSFLHSVHCKSRSGNRLSLYKSCIEYEYHAHKSLSKKIRPNDFYYICSWW